jgi:hypothetical protein
MGRAGLQLLIGDILAADAGDFGRIARPQLERVLATQAHIEAALDVALFTGEKLANSRSSAMANVAGVVVAIGRILAQRSAMESIVTDTKGWLAQR